MLVPKRSDDDDDEEDSSKDAEKEKLPDQRFERYKTIMDRMPFGPEPAGFDPDSGSRGAGGADAIDPNAIQQQLSEEAQRILASVRVSALNVTPSGKVAVGFTDSSQQPAVTYYMKVGESRNGWSVKDADVKAMTVTLEKDGVEATMKLGEGSDGSKGGKGPSGVAGRMGGGRPMMGGMGRGMGGGMMGRGMGRGSGGMTSAGGMNGMPPANETGSDALARLRARRAQKEAERQAENARVTAAAELARQEAAAEREKAAAEREKAAAAREQQMEAIRQIQEEMRRRREAEEQQKAEAQQQQQQQPQPES